MQVYAPNFDPAGSVSPLEGATVTLAATKARPIQQVSATTKADGFLAFQGASPGWYALDVHIEGFASVHREIHVVPRGEAPAWTIVALMANPFSCSSQCEIVSVNGPLAAFPQCFVPKPPRRKR